MPINLPAVIASVIMAFLAGPGAADMFGGDALPGPRVTLDGLPSLFHPPHEAFHCVSDPATEAYNLLLYAIPRELPDHYDVMAPILREAFRDANDELVQRFAEFGVEARFAMRCADGDVEVGRVVTGSMLFDSPFNGVAADLMRKGFGDPLAHYWVWYDDVNMFALAGLGIGSREDDDRPTADNRNNDGPSYAIIYSHPAAFAAGGFLWLHEVFHTMGAVQTSAPHSDGSGHCDDWPDLMCLGPPVQDAFITCHVNTIDCHADDYFHPSPPAGSYLANHWNTAHRRNRYVHFDP